MKAQLFDLFEIILTLALIPVAACYKWIRRKYRKFCIKVLWKKFQIRTPVYREWHDRKVHKLQLELDKNNNF